MYIKTTYKFSSLLLFIFISIFVAKIPSAIAASTEVIQLTTSGQREDWPMIYKSSVYWSDASEIRGYNFKNNQEILLAKVGYQLPVDFFAPTAYDGRNLVYNTYSEAKGYNVRVYDFKRKKEIVITDEIGSNTATDYDNNTVVYIEGGACGKLHAFDLRLMKDILVSETVCGPAKISKNIIVWGYAAPNGSNVYGYDLRKKKQFDIANIDGFQDSPDIYEGNVVWLHNDGVNQEIHVKNLNTNKEKTLTTSNSYSMSWPSITKRYVVWGKSTEQHIAGIEGFDLKSNNIFDIQEQGPHQNANMSPIVDGNIASWMAWRTGNGDIYAAQLIK